MGGKISAVFIAAYVASAFLTGANYYNHRCDERSACGPESIAVGGYWPAYWLGRASLAITK